MTPIELMNQAYQVVRKATFRVAFSYLERGCVVRSERNTWRCPQSLPIDNPRPDTEQLPLLLEEDTYDTWEL